MTDSANYFQHHRNLVRSLYQHCRTQLPFSSEQATEVDLEFLEGLKQLSEIDQFTDDFTFQGQSVICKIISHYPHITPEVSRDLLWYFGGDCLHYMSDEEISLYQQIDELLYQAQNQGEPVDFSTAKAHVFKLN